MSYIEDNFCETLPDGLLIPLQTMMVWLWGVNLWVFLQSNVSYTKIFDLDQNHLTHNEIWKVVNFFAFLFQKTNFNAKWKVVCCFSWFSILTINISTMKLWCVSSCLKHNDNQINKCPCTKKKIMPLYGLSTAEKILKLRICKGTVGG